MSDTFLITTYKKNEDGRQKSFDVLLQDYDEEQAISHFETYIEDLEDSKPEDVKVELESMYYDQTEGVYFSDELIKEYQF